MKKVRWEYLGPNHSHNLCDTAAGIFKRKIYELKKAGYQVSSTIKVLDLFNKINDLEVKKSTEKVNLLKSKTNSKVKVKSKSNRVTKNVKKIPINNINFYIPIEDYKLSGIAKLKVNENWKNSGTKFYSYRYTGIGKFDVHKTHNSIKSHEQIFTLKSS